jgi:hypothetical protein
MQRRSVCSFLPLAAAVSLASSYARGAQSPAPALLPRQYVNFSDWLTDARAAASNYLRDFGVADTERFMKLLSLWTSAMPQPPEPAWQAVPGAETPLEMATIAAGRPFVVSAFRMGPGAVLPLHCHPGGGGITLCTAGSLAIQHFELCDDQPPFSETGAHAEVRQVQVAQLERRQSTLFTPSLANLHQFNAGSDGAAGVEIAVQWQGAGEFSFLRLQEPVAVESFRAGRRLKGQWVGMSLGAM